MSAPSTDELLQDLKVRDFVVLGAHAGSESARSPCWLWFMKPGPLYVRRAEQRLADRGLLVLDDGDPRVTPEGRRALRVGMAMFELEGFELPRP